jgi:penicillin-binding protein 1A
MTARSKPAKKTNPRGGASRKKASKTAPGRGGARRAGAKNAAVGWPRRLLIWGAVAAIWGGIALVAALVWYVYDLPNVDDMDGVSRAPNVTIVSDDGTKIASFGGIYGEPVGIASLPPYLPQAVIAVEDRRFYDHFGVDLRGLARASWRNFRAGRIVEGGSTITQQLAKNLFLSPERTIRRKVQEILLALWLEHRFTKDQIFSIYLNRVYLGAGAYGVDAAARRYFGKSAREVSLYEAALLAGLLKAPSRLNPLRNPDQADARTGLVLVAMQATGAISEAEAESAKAGGATASIAVKGWAPYFADWIMAQLSGYLGGIGTDVSVTTTLDPALQRIAEEELQALLAQSGAARGVSQAAVVILDKNGAVRAMVGGQDYRESQFNRASQALRQPGSAFKPFVYLAGLETGVYTPDTKVLDAPIDIAGWRPRNYADKYYGEVTLRESFARSLNSVAVRITDQVGPKKVAAAAQRLGVTTELAANGSIALGTSEVTLLELTAAYAAFANQGYGVWPHGIREISGARGQMLYRRQELAEPSRLVAPEDVRDMVDLMTAAVAWGSGKAANPGRWSAGKTGTSQGFRDAWFLGFSGPLIAGIWMGNDDNAPMKGVTGGSLPAQLWGRIIRRALEGQPDEPFADPTLLAGSDGENPEGGGFIQRILTRLKTSSGADEDQNARRLNRFLEPNENRR